MIYEKGRPARLLGAWNALLVAEQDVEMKAVPESERATAARRWVRLLALRDEDRRTALVLRAAKQGLKRRLKARMLGIGGPGLRTKVLCAHLDALPPRQRARAGSRRPRPPPAARSPAAAGGADGDDGGACRWCASPWRGLPGRRRRAWARSTLRAVQSTPPRPARGRERIEVLLAALPVALDLAYHQLRVTQNRDAVDLEPPQRLAAEEERAVFMTFRRGRVRHVAPARPHGGAVLVEHRSQARGPRVASTATIKSQFIREGRVHRCSTRVHQVARLVRQTHVAFTDAGGPELWWSERWRVVEAMRTYYEQCGPHRTELSIRNCAHCTCLFSRSRSAGNLMKIGKRFTDVCLLLLMLACCVVAPAAKPRPRRAAGASGL